jgi:hypothetical protein
LKKSSLSFFKNEILCINATNRDIIVLTITGKGDILMEKTRKMKYSAKTRSARVYDAYIEPSDKESSDTGKTEENVIKIEEINAVISRYNRHINNFHQKIGEWV